MVESVVFLQALLGGAAHSLAQIPVFEEADQAIGESINELRRGAKYKQTGAGTAANPTWDIDLGDFDVKVWLPGEELPSILIETKVDDYF